MSREVFDPECAGCRPVLIDPETGKITPETDPVMVAILEAWKWIPRDQKEAWHRFTCQNSRDPNDLRLMTIVQAVFERACRKTVAS